MGLFDKFKKKSQNDELIICSPITGEVSSVDQTPDEAFANKMMGDGVVILPENGEVVAPFDGEVAMVFPTKHAMGLRSENGTEILIHFGLETNALNGEGFDVLVKEGDKVKTGDPLMNVDVDFIKSKDILTNVPMVFTTLPEGKTMEIVKTGNVSKGDEIIKIK